MYTEAELIDRAEQAKIAATAIRWTIQIIEHTRMDLMGGLMPTACFLDELERMEKKLKESVSVVD